MPTFYSQDDNSEVWETKPEGYLTEEEWLALQPKVEKPVVSFEETKNFLVNALNAAISKNITKGFNQVVDGVEYHFNYDLFDQQNFADAAVVGLANTGITTIVWNGYQNWTPETGGTLVRLELDKNRFMSIYLAAMVHKANTMTEGGAVKARINTCTTKKEMFGIFEEYTGEKVPEKYSHEVE